MGTGEAINSTENRAVMHVALRSPANKSYFVNNANVVPAVHAVLNQIDACANAIRSGEWVGATGKPLTNVISIGIGGSYLGPEFVYEALKTDPVAQCSAHGRTLRFLANVDPVDVARATDGLDPEKTLVVIVSKTFTTAETMLNARTIKEWLLQSIPQAEARDIIRKQMIAVRYYYIFMVCINMNSTATEKVREFGISDDNIFAFWDWVGGRYSVCSAVGMLPLSLHYGYSTMKQFLAGAHDMDLHFFEAPMSRNLPLILGLLGVWNSTFLKHPCRAILPYAQALLRFAAHIQQVDMESNGKRVDIDGNVLPYECGEVVFGEPGTNGQHSFYQLVHQGRVVPAEFIGFCQSPAPRKLSTEDISNHDELMCNFFAQPDALALGKTVSELVAEGVPTALLPHKEFTGNRPSLSLLFPKLDAFSCGQLLSLYEHRVAVQGFIWNINSFDQWGVELGKVLANKVRSAVMISRISDRSDVLGFNPSTTSLLKRYLSYKATSELDNIPA